MASNRMPPSAAPEPSERPRPNLRVFLLAALAVTCVVMLAVKMMMDMTTPLPAGGQAKPQPFPALLHFDRHPKPDKTPERPNQPPNDRTVLAG